MAIDTNNKKLALISFYQPFNTPIPVSSDGLGQDDKQHLIWGYPGILWSAAQELNLTVIVSGSVSGTDIQIYVETGLTIIASGSVSGSDVQNMVESNKTVTIAGGVSGIDSAIRVESGLSVLAAGIVTEVDVATYRDTVTISAAGVVTGVDIQSMVEYDKTVTGIGFVSGSDILPGVFVVAAFVVLRQVTS